MIRINYGGEFYNGDHISFNEPHEEHFELKIETHEEGEHGPEKVWKPIFEGLTKNLNAVFSISIEESMRDYDEYLVSRAEGQGD